MQPSEHLMIVSPLLKELANKLSLTVGLGKISITEKEIKGEVLSSAVPDKSFGFNIQPGYKFPLHSSAPGKAMLSVINEKSWDDLLQKINFKAFNKNTITTHEGFKKALFETRSLSYGVDLSEEIDNCRCLAVSFFYDNGIEDIRSIWITGQSKDVHEKDFHNIVKHLKVFSKKIESKLLKFNPEKNSMLLTIQQLDQFMNEKIDQDIDIKAWIAQKKYSYSWFCQFFKKNKGLSPNQYFIWLRLKKSKEMLIQTDMNIKQISTLLGFQNQNHFSSLFKRKIGMSPIAYRNNNESK